MANYNIVINCPVDKETKEKFENLDFQKKLHKLAIKKTGKKFFMAKYFRKKIAELMENPEKCMDDYEG